MRGLFIWLSVGLIGTVQAGPFDHEWCRYETPEFEFVTDVSAERVAQLTERMLIFRQAVQPFIHGDREFREQRIKVVAFRDAADFRSVLNTPHFTGFMQPSLEQSLLIVSPGTDNRWLTENALHEYTHFLVRNRLDVSIPTWYDEGLASLLSTAKIQRREVVLGHAPVPMIRAALRGDTLSLQQTLATEVLFELELAELNDLYLTSWALMHYLSFGSHQTKELEAYLRAEHPSLPAALGLTHAELDAQLQRYTSRRRLPRIRLPKPVVHMPALEARCLQPFERDQELGMVMALGDFEAGLAVIERLSAERPDDPALLLDLALLRSRANQVNAALALAEQALAVAPDHPGAKIRVALLLSRSCMFSRVQGCSMKWKRASTLLQEATESAPGRIDAQLGLGLAYLHRNEPVNAVAPLREAYERAPWEPQVNLFLGEAYRLLGDERAVRLLTNARNWAETQVIKRLASSALEQLSGRRSGDEVSGTDE